MLDAEQRLQLFARHNGTGTWEWHIPTGRQVSSTTLTRRLGYGAEEAAQVASQWLELIHPADADAVKLARRALAEGRSEEYRVEYRVRRQDKGWNWIRSAGHIVERDEAGRPIWAAGTVCDITREKESERLFHAIFERPFQFIGLLSADGVLLEINRTSLKAWKCEAQEVLGRLFWECPRVGDTEVKRKQIQEGFARAIRGEIVRFEMSHILDENGTRQVVDFTMTPLFDEEGKLINVVPEGRDITDLVKARDALRAMEIRLIIATSSANIGLWDSDLQTGDTWRNDQWYAMLGYEPGELPQKRHVFAQLCHPDDRQRVLSSLDAHIQGHAADHRTECRMRCKDGSWRWLLTHARVVERDASGKALRIAGVHMDITERKEIEMQLASAQRLECVGQLAAGVAHEINTPVQYISDSIHFIRDGVQELLDYVDALRALQQRPLADDANLAYLKENLPTALARSIDGLERVTEIVRSMRDFSHPDQKEMSAVDLNRAVQSALVMAKNEYKFVAELETRFGPLPSVVCHGGEVHQVILNLVINAVHAIEEAVKGTDRKGRITICTRQDGDEVVISVADTGTGIPEAIHHRIFEPFFTTKEVGKGTGQGLSIARNIIVRRHGGSLSFQTQMNVGTNFVIRLPMVAKPQDVEVAAA